MPHKSFVTFVLPHTTTRAEKWPLLSVSFLTLSQWVKITQKVSINNLASEASNYLSLELLVFMRLFWWIWTTVLNSQWLKITQKVSFYSFASEASFCLSLRTFKFHETFLVNLNHCDSDWKSATATVLKNYMSRIQHCERSELFFHIEWTKVC